MYANVVPAQVVRAPDFVLKGMLDRSMGIQNLQKFRGMNVVQNSQKSGTCSTGIIPRVWFCNYPAEHNLECLYVLFWYHVCLFSILCFCPCSNLTTTVFVSFYIFLF